MVKQTCNHTYAYTRFIKWEFPTNAPCRFCPIIDQVILHNVTPGHLIRPRSKSHRLTVIFPCRTLRFARPVQYDDFISNDPQNCTLEWRHNGHDGVSNHQPHDYLLNRLLRRRSKKTPKFRVTGFVWGIHRWPVNSPHKWLVTRKMFPFDDVIM